MGYIRGGSVKAKVILADPPWRFATWSDKGKGRSPENHYSTMSMEQLYALPVADIADENCVLFLWCIWTLLPQALALGEAWGFKYKTCAYDWAKQTKHGKWHIGLGYYTRQNTEVCLLFTRGKPKRVDKGVRQLVIAPAQQHSQKPAIVHESIERLMGEVTRVELFARQTRPGWICLGNEIDGLDITEAIGRLMEREA